MPYPPPDNPDPLGVSLPGVPDDFATADEVERGKLLFQRASEARDGLIAATRESAAAIERAAQASALDGGAVEEAAAAQAVAQASCSTQLDEAIYQGLSYLVETSREARPASRRTDTRT